eukprot:Tamp_22208.p1 GENE.Tamp_22208~~Tamp_22208.p1  ORF type:complete len:363 (+),score=63.36 Tamp_22208:24-1091(+)
MARPPALLAEDDAPDLATAATASVLLGPVTIMDAKQKEAIYDYVVPLLLSYEASMNLEITPTHEAEKGLYGHRKSLSRLVTSSSELGNCYIYHLNGTKAEKYKRPADEMWAPNRPGLGAAKMFYQKENEPRLMYLGTDWQQKSKKRARSEAGPSAAAGTDTMHSSSEGDEGVPPPPPLDSRSGETGNATGGLPDADKPPTDCKVWMFHLDQTCSECGLSRFVKPAKPANPTNPAEPASSSTPQCHTPLPTPPAVCIVLPWHTPACGPDERHLEDDFLKAFALKVSQNPEENPHSMLKSNITDWPLELQARLKSTVAKGFKRMRDDCLQQVQDAFASDASDPIASHHFLNLNPPPR